MPNKAKPISICLISFLCLCASCSSPEKAVSRENFICTIHPAAMILNELTETKVKALVPPGASEHTYEPTPEDAIRAGNALALIYISKDLDAWSAKLDAKSKLALFDLLPGEYILPMPELDHSHTDHHHHGAHDPHFWMDPLSVKALLGVLVTKLTALDPQQASQITAKAKKFSDTLILLDTELRTSLASLKGKKVILHHPSLRYFLKRYGLEVAGYIESSPGKEPTPQHIAKLLEMVKTENVSMICSEPQLSSQAAQTLADGAGIPLVEVDILGGRNGLDTYSDLLRYNAAKLQSALP